MQTQAISAEKMPFAIRIAVLPMIGATGLNSSHHAQRGEKFL
jgi:hypothetical protein